MNNVTTRPATLADFDAIYEFVCGLEEQRFDKAALRQCYEVTFSMPYSHYLVAELGHKPVGYISCRGQILMHHCGLVYEIQELYVLPEHRSAGIGKILLNAMLERLAKEDYELVEVCSNMRRKDAHRFYLSNGFEQTSYKFRKEPK